ncbi:MAG: hypothetical protein U0U09_18735 [Cyclobacteriaceae bacterium]
MFKRQFAKGILWEEVSEKSPQLHEFLQVHSITNNFKTSIWSKILFRKDYLFLMHDHYHAILIWRRARLFSSQKGVECYLFINNSFTFHHELITEAVEIVKNVWREDRFFVNIKEHNIRHTTGDCFAIAGWSVQENHRCNRKYMALQYCHSIALGK